MQGRGLTSNKDNVYSVDSVKVEEETFVLASGRDGVLDVFRLGDLKEDGFTSREMIVLDMAYSVILLVKPRPLQVCSTAEV